MAAGRASVLTPVTDVAVADWFVRSRTPWRTLATEGPPGFEAYARVHFDREPEPRTDAEVFADVLGVVVPHTATPDQAWCALWDGWGGLDDDPSAALLHAAGGGTWSRRFFPSNKPTTVPPAFAEAVLTGPRVLLGDDAQRAYLLFTGALADAGQWGARPIGPGWPARHISEPNLMWPADRAWFVANDPEPDWLTVGGTAELVAALVRHPRIWVERTTHGASG